MRIGFAFSLVALAALGCRSKDSQPATSNSSAPLSPLVSAAASSPAPSASIAQASPKRELSLRELRLITQDFPAAKPEPTEKQEIPQLVFRQIFGGHDAYCGAHINGPVRCWGNKSDSVSGAFTQVAFADSFLCGIETGARLTCTRSGQKFSPFAATSASASAPNPAGSAPAISANAASESTKYKAVAAGPSSACALDDQGHVQCWGDPKACQLPDPPAESGFRKIAVGDCHACAIDVKGSVKCWGTADSPAILPPAELNAKEIALGTGYSCAINSKNELSCWGKVPAIPENLPADLEKLGARESNICVLAKAGTLRCWGGATVNEAGPFSAIGVASRSVCAFAAKDKIACFGDDTSGQLKIPEDTSLGEVLDAGRTPEERTAKKKKRADLFQELISQLPERELPIKLDRNAQIPVGLPVDEKFLPVLDAVNFEHFFPRNHYHYGFKLKTDRKFTLIVMHDSGVPTLMAFSPEGKRIGKHILADYRAGMGDGKDFDDGDVFEATTREAEIGPDLKIKTLTTVVLEVLGVKKDAHKIIRNFCKVRENAEFHLVVSTGVISQTGSDGKVSYEKYGDEACQGRWVLGNPRK